MSRWSSMLGGVLSRSGLDGALHPRQISINRLIISRLWQIRLVTSAMPGVEGVAYGLVLLLVFLLLFDLFRSANLLFQG